MKTERLPLDIAEAMAKASGRLGVFSGRLAFFPVVASTNDVATKLAADGIEDGTTVLAGEQTAGRGRHGRKWFSPPGAGLYFSTVIRGIQATKVTLMAGVAIAEGIRTATGLLVELKWPNDIVASSPIASGRPAAKIGGILAETSRTGGVAEAIILGVGINIRPTDYPVRLATLATSVETELGTPVDSTAVLVESLASLARWRSVLTSDGVGQILQRWRELAPMSEGNRVSWEEHGIRRQGITEGIDHNGALLVRSGSTVERLIAGELTWLSPLAISEDNENISNR